MWWMLLIWRWLRRVSTRGDQRKGRFYRRFVRPEPIRRKNRRKPDWLRDFVMRTKAVDADISYRGVAAVVNRQFGHRETICHTTVRNILIERQAEVLLYRKALRRRKPRIGPKNHIWGLDLTGKTDTEGKTHWIQGILDHGTRACISLQAVPSKASIQLLRGLLDAIERYGIPGTIRTDNEAIFTSRLFRFGLWWLGIRHQRIDLACPWQNGRIERFFGTLKGKLNRLAVSHFEGLNVALAEFRLWYNHVRPHQSLEYLTPAEVWQRRSPGRKAIRFETWEGLLTGWYHPPD